MKQKWMVHGKRADFKKIGEALGIDQVTARILRNRDLISEEEIDRFLNGDLTKLHSPFLLKDLDKDFYLSQEWHGAGLLCCKSVLISNRVYKFFVDNKIKNINAEPIKFI